MPEIVLEQVTKLFQERGAAPLAAVRDLNLRVADGELLALLGPSGCGKTTTLRLIAGLEKPSSGRVIIDGADMAGVPPQSRGTGMVFQSGALFPHLSVFENLALGLRLRHCPRAETDQRVREVANQLGLAALLDQLPGSLSGGERQRVALGRALASRPRILLLDEPLAALDALLRLQLRREIARLHRQSGATTIHVTHDQAEALALGHRVAVLRAGELQQVGPPRELYERPANLFVAGFIGSPPMNLIPGRLIAREGRLDFLAGDAAAPAFALAVPPGAGPARFNPGVPVTLGLRAQDVKWEANGPTVGRQNALSGAIELVETVGAETTVQVAVGPYSLVARGRREVVARPGDRVIVTPCVEHAHFFDTITGRRL